MVDYSPVYYIDRNGKIREIWYALKINGEGLVKNVKIYGEKEICDATPEMMHKYKPVCDMRRIYGENE